MILKLTATALLALLSTASFSQVALSNNAVSEGDKIKDEFWQAKEILSSAFAIMYDPYTKASKFGSYEYDSTTFEFKYQSAATAYFTTIYTPQVKEFKFMSIDIGGNKFRTIGYYIDPADNYLVLQQLQCNQDSFKTTNEFYNFVRSKLNDPGFLKPYARLYNRKITELTAPVGYVNKTNQLKVSRLTNIDLKTASQTTVSSLTLKPTGLNKYSLVTLSMPNASCPPCKSAVEAICNKIDGWKKEFKLDYYLVTCLGKDNLLSRFSAAGFKKDMKDRFTLYFDEDYAFANSLDIESFPVTLLINDKAVIVKMFMGNYQSADFYNWLKEIK
jgi:hypothetical protein